MNVPASDKAPYNKTFHNSTRNCNVDMNLGGKLNTKKKIMTRSMVFAVALKKNNLVFFFSVLSGFGAPWKPHIARSLRILKQIAYRKFT